MFTTIVAIWILFGFLTSILVVAALMLSSRLSQEEGVEERHLPDDAADTEQLKRFPRSR